LSDRALRRADGHRGSRLRAGEPRESRLRGLRPRRRERLPRCGRRIGRRALTVPPGLEWWRDEPGGAEWLERLPRLAAELADEWELELGTPFEPAHISLVLPARRANGSPAVLKVNFPEPESEHEAEALAGWDGKGAVRLLARDDERRALLVERCLPGTQLWALDENEANEIAADVL